MANTIKIKNSGTASNVPASLEYGELGINYADGKLFYKNSLGNIVEFGSFSGSSIDSLTDVVIDTPLTYQGLMYDGTNWVNSSIPNVFLVRNDSGSTILKGTLVAADGAEGSGRINIVPYESDGTENSELRAMGILAETLTDGQSGEVMSFGTLKSLDTRGTVESGLAVGDETWAAGDILYAHPTVAGKLTKVQPQHDFPVAFITVLGNGNGQIAIRVIPQNKHLEWMHDVSLTSPASGDFLKYNGSVWVNDPINLGTDTVGNYMSNVSAGTGISISHTPGEGSTATITNAGVTSVNGSTGAITGVVRTSDTGTVTSTMITDGTIVNGDINTAAAISHSKLASITAGSVLLGNATNVPTSTALSGDVTINSSGVTAISAGVIVNADISASASIATSKISGLATSATTDTTNASNITSGTLPNARLSSIPNSSLANTSITVNGTAISLGSSGTIAANASTLTGTSLNSSVTGSSLTSVGTLTSLSVSGNVAVTGSVVDHVIISNVALTAGTYTLVLTDDGKIIEVNSASSSNVSIPADNTVNFPVGTSIDILQVGSGQITITKAAGVTLNSSAGTTPKTRLQWSAATIIKRAANTWVAIGDLSA